MSSESYEKNVEWERKIQQKLNKIYVDVLGLDVISRKGERRFDLTVRDQKTLQSYTLEEKIIKNVYPLLSVELIQDLKTGSLGWIYTESPDLFHWVMCQEEEPKIIYQVSFVSFKKWYLENAKHFYPDTFRVEPDGWGLTLHHLIHPAYIPELKTYHL